MVEVEQLVKRYGNTLAVDRMSFKVARGEIVGFLGPNGAGKSTTMRIITGFLPATSGKASVAGHDVFSDSLAARAQVGYLPEGAPVYPDMRVTEYLLYRAAVKGVPSARRKRRVAEVMERCRVADVRRKLVGALSKGYRQRLGLADALVADPPVLILDEPTIGLDPRQIREVRALMRDLGRDHTVLLSTHILPEVEMVCDRVLIMHRGRLVFGDTMDRAGPDHAARVVVEMCAPIDEARPRIAALPSVRSLHVEQAGEAARFNLETDAEAALCEALGRLAVEERWPLRQLTASRPTLEETFIRLTAEGEA
jgi:ABC-2 type transport system ATP-binding protein